MCIVIVTTAHPNYPLILLNNRDEFLHRPTAPADWWDPPYDYVLGGRDLHRKEHGTWLGITKQGRVACLTNFREEGQAIIEGRRSRGAIVNAFLKAPADSAETTSEAAETLINEGVSGVGGFSLLFGHLRRDGSKGLAIVSNRSTNLHSVKWLCRHAGETHALSNSHYGDRTWPKVVEAEDAVTQAMKVCVADHASREEIIARCLEILSKDTLPKREVGEDWEIYLRQLRHSVFVPPIGLAEQKAIEEINRTATPRDGTTPRAATPAVNGEKMRADKVANGVVDGVGVEQQLVVEATHGVYGTQKQSVILVDREGRVTFFERTLFGMDGALIDEGAGDRMFEFQIEGW